MLSENKSGGSPTEFKKAFPCGLWTSVLLVAAVVEIMVAVLLLRMREEQARGESRHWHERSAHRPSGAHHQPLRHDPQGHDHDHHQHHHPGGDMPPQLRGMIDSTKHAVGAAADRHHGKPHNAEKTTAGPPGKHRDHFDDFWHRAGHEGHGWGKDGRHELPDHPHGDGVHHDDYGNAFHKYAHGDHGGHSDHGDHHHERAGRDHGDPHHDRGDHGDHGDHHHERAGREHGDPHHDRGDHPGGASPPKHHHLPMPGGLPARGPTTHAPDKHDGHLGAPHESRAEHAGDGAGSHEDAHHLVVRSLEGPGGADHADGASSHEDAHHPGGADHGHDHKKGHHGWNFGKHHAHAKSADDHAGGHHGAETPGGSDHPGGDAHHGSKGLEGLGAAHHGGDHAPGRARDEGHGGSTNDEVHEGAGRAHLLAGGAPPHHPDKRPRTTHMPPKEHASAHAEGAPPQEHASAHAEGAAAEEKSPAAATGGDVVAASVA